MSEAEVIPVKKEEIIRDKEGKFVKGFSGNPSMIGVGRPKGSGLSITTAVKAKLDEVPKGEKKTYLALLIDKIFTQAIKEGNEQMIKQIWNYIDGLPQQGIDLNVKDFKRFIVEQPDDGSSNNS